MTTVGATTIAAIPTRYAGCHFRSRLEARWAVFFDHLGIRWEYEPQGFEGRTGSRYLPDFHMTDLGFYVEVKGSDAQLRGDADKIGDCIDWSATPLSNGLLILGDVPRGDVPGCVAITHSYCYHRKGVEVEQRGFGKGWDGTWSLSERGVMNYWFEGNASDTLPDEATTTAIEWHPQRIRWGARTQIAVSPSWMPDLIAAYTAARSARFEHGQSGATQPAPARPVAEVSDRPATADTFKIGDHVAHPAFGGGVVLEARDRGGDTEVTVNFDDVGIKHLSVSFAPLSRAS